MCPFFQADFESGMDFDKWSTYFFQEGRIQFMPSNKKTKKQTPWLKSDVT
jgi:hypothetical protein